MSFSPPPPRCLVLVSRATVLGSRRADVKRVAVRSMGDIVDKVRAKLSKSVSMPPASPSLTADFPSVFAVAAKRAGTKNEDGGGFIDADGKVVTPKATSGFVTLSVTTLQPTRSDPTTVDGLIAGRATPTTPGSAVSDGSGGLSTPTAFGGLVVLPPAAEKGTGSMAVDQRKLLKAELNRKLSARKAEARAQAEIWYVFHLLASGSFFFFFFFLGWLVGWLNFKLPLCPNLLSAPLGLPGLGCHQPPSPLLFVSLFVQQP